MDHLATLKSLLSEIFTHFVAGEEGKVLLEQVHAIREVSGKITFLDIDIDPNSIGRVSYKDGSIPLDITVFESADHKESIGMILIWIEAGILSAFEYAWVTDDEPTTLPHFDQLKLIKS